MANPLHASAFELPARARVFGVELATSGAVTGIISGICMALLLMLYSAVIGQGIVLPVNLISGVFFGVDAVIGGVGAFLLGLILHVVVSAAFGVLFAFIARSLASPRSTLLAGLAYGIAVWALMTYVILPGLNPTMSERVALMPAWWFFCHLVYGAILYLTPFLFLRYFAERERVVVMDRGV